MADTLLDKHPGSRRYVAHLHSYGATREQICTKLAEKYPMRRPTPRIMTTWLNKDPELVKMIRELADIKQEMTPGDSALAELPEPVDPAEASGDLFDLAVGIPAFGRLLHREGKRDEDDPAEDDVSAVLAAGHSTAAEFEADCIRRLDSYDPHGAGVKAAESRRAHQYA